MGNKSQKTCATKTWENLDYAILVKIFMKLSILDLVSGVSRVCNEWRMASRDPLLWGTLDVNKLKLGFTTSVSQPHCVWLDEQQSLRLMQSMKNALTLSSNHITKLIFDFSVNIKDEYLISSAERCSNLRQLVIPSWNQITANGLCVAIGHLKALESLTLPCNYCPGCVIAAIGKSCRNLTQLKLMCPYDIDLACSLFMHIPKLTVLSVRCSLVHKDALGITLTLSDLDVLNISHSLIVETNQSTGLITLSRDRNLFTNTKAFQLKKVFTCDKEGCTMCKRVVRDVGRLKWQEYEEGLWRNDEVPSLAI